MECGDCDVSEGLEVQAALAAIGGGAAPEIRWHLTMIAWHEGQIARLKAERVAALAQEAKQWA